MENNLLEIMGEEKKGDTNKDYVLVSCVGSTDPIKFNYDGPILHICRYYSPKRVYLLYTREMYEINRLSVNDDESIEYVLNNSLIDENIPEVIIKRTNIIDAHHYDAFYEEVKEIFERVKSENPNSNILINLTSGTQQITSNFMNYYLSENDPSLIPLQVSTPKKGSNYPDDKNDYKKVDKLIATNNDNLYINKINESKDSSDKRVSLSEIFKENKELEPKNRLIYPDLEKYQRERVIARIKGYVRDKRFDFAYEVFENELRSDNKKLKSWLEFAISKTQVDRKKSNKLIEEIYALSDEDERKKIPKFLDRRNYTSKAQEFQYDIFDYFALALLKYNSGDISGYILMMEPFFMNLYVSILRDVLKLDLNRFIKEEVKKDKVIPFSYLVDDSEEAKKILEKTFRYNYNKKSYISKAYLDAVIDHVLKPYKDKHKSGSASKEEKSKSILHKHIKDLSKGYETLKKTRNSLAHGLEQMNNGNEISQSITAFNKKIKNFCNMYYKDYGFDAEMFNLYAYLEEKILELLKSE